MAKNLNDIGKPTKCRRCGAAYTYMSLGVYECKECGYIEKDDYARVREYIEENGSASAITISVSTGVPVDRINTLLREGRLEIPNNSEIFIKCESCGADIRFGRLCPTCAAKLSSGFRSSFNDTSVGEKPSKPASDKMRFLGNRKKK